MEKENAICCVNVLLCVHAIQLVVFALKSFFAICSPVCLEFWMTDAVGNLANLTLVVFYMQMQRYFNFNREIICTTLRMFALSTDEWIQASIVILLFLLYFLLLDHSIGLTIPFTLFREIEHTLCWYRFGSFTEIATGFRVIILANIYLFSTLYHLRSMLYYLEATILHPSSINETFQNARNDCQANN